ncbi:MAG: hypothetical protein HY290_20660 [Planctomycetia bacterium]|nr:hypothetical protein [Planctomycetia bacterium]
MPSAASDPSTAPNQAVAPAAVSRLPPRKLSMALVNFWLDAVLLVTAAFVGWVTVVMRVVFPAPTFAAGWSLWGLTYNQWHDLQFGSLCFGALVILLHVMLHWNWVCSVIGAQILHLRRRPDEGLQTIYGVATLIALLMLILAGVIAAIVTVHPAGTP